MKPGKLIVALIASTPLVAVGQTDLTTQKQKFSYTMGVGIGSDMIRRGSRDSVEVEAFVQGIRDVLTEGEMKLTAEEMQAAIEVEREKIAKVQQALAEENRKAGEQYLLENAEREGVMQTESGLQYEIIEAGGGEKPEATDTVVVHYRGTLINGVEFDSSYKRNEPATFPVTGVIAGWQEGLQLMQEGAKWKFYIPSDLAYGENGAGNLIGPNATLIFEVELKEIK